MKNELTHEQAALLSLIADEVKRNGTCRAFDSLFLEDFEDAGHPLYLLIETDDYIETARLTDAGQKALAAYKETWVPVRKEDLALALSHFNANIIYAATVADISNPDAEIVRDRLRAALEAR